VINETVEPGEEIIRQNKSDVSSEMEMVQRIEKADTSESGTETETNQNGIFCFIFLWKKYIFYY